MIRCYIVMGSKPHPPTKQGGRYSVYQPWSLVVDLDLSHGRQGKALAKAEADLACRDETPEYEGRRFWVRVVATECV